MKVLKGNLSFFKYVSLKTKGNNYRCPTQGAENYHLQAEGRALEDILANSPDCLLAVFFSDTFLPLHQRVDPVRFFLEDHDFAQPPKNRS